MIGKKAPAFKLKNQTGKECSLKDYQGRYMVLYFYPKDNTPGCTKESCRFNELKKDFDGLDATILGLSADTESSHQKFSDKFGFEFDLLSDPEHVVLEKYGAWGEKKNYGKTYMGIIRSTVIVDPKGKVLAHWNTVKGADKHPDEVLNKLKELIQGNIH